MHPQPHDTPAPLGPVALPGGLAVGTFALAFFIGLYQLSNSNRPHELTAAPYVAALLALTVVLALVALHRLGAAWRAREQHPLGLGHGVLAAVLIPLVLLGTLLFIETVSTAIDVFSAESSPGQRGSSRWGAPAIRAEGRL